MLRKKKNADWGTHNEISAFLGQASEFSGQLKFDGVLRLDGRFSGEIFSNGTLIVGTSALVRATIDVDTVIVSGEVQGNIRAKNRVQLHSPAKHYGDIISPVVTIDEGVVFEGNCVIKDLSSEELEIPAKNFTLISMEDETAVDSENI